MAVAGKAPAGRPWGRHLCQKRRGDSRAGSRFLAAARRRGISSRLSPLDARHDVSIRPPLPAATTPLQGNKRHPKDWRALGRVRVELKSPEGTPVHATVHTKEQLLSEIVKIIPRLEGRRVRLQQTEAYQKQIEDARAAAAPGATKKKDKKEKAKKKG
jgi:hypothetical protein